jgi:FkbM family methyltransferase
MLQGKIPEITDTIHGFRLYLNPEDRNVSLALALHKTYETDISPMFPRVVKEGGTVIDIGANIGYYSVFAGKIVGDGGKIYAFEPEPANYALLQRNIELNGLRNVITVRKAVSNKSGIVRLYLSGHAPDSHSTVERSKRFVDVECVTIDDFLSNSKVDVIKMDIEGAEMLAILGMDRTIRENPGIKMFVEYWPEGIKLSGHDPTKFLTTLLGYGFQIYDIRRNKLLTHVKAINSFKVIETNLFVTRADLMSLYIRQNEQKRTYLPCDKLSYSELKRQEG